MYNLTSQCDWKENTQLSYWNKIFWHKPNGCFSSLNRHWSQIDSFNVSVACLHVVDYHVKNTWYSFSMLHRHLPLHFSLYLLIMVQKTLLWIVSWRSNEAELARQIPILLGEPFHFIGHLISIHVKWRVCSKNSFCSSTTSPNCLFSRNLCHVNTGFQQVSS